ncbi:GTP pyrophosphokinase [Actinoplanes philippinensis]|uniref:GTP pyrophosphokinase n=1 Tax=Actinoplanes philippinensis TaxID=35752 RepID=UPI0033C5B559
MTDFVEKRDVTTDQPGQLARRGHPEAWHEQWTDLNHFLMVYKFGLAEINTKITILAEELTHRGSGNPIEHVSPRLKSPASITAKARRLNCPLHFDDLRSRIRDIAGIRIVCSFVSDVYTVANMLTRQPDVNLVVTKDYIAKPKPNGYRSLHLIVDRGGLAGAVGHEATADRYAVLGEELLCLMFQQIHRASFQEVIGTGCEGGAERGKRSATL